MKKDELMKKVLNSFSSEKKRFVYENEKLVFSIMERKVEFVIPNDIEELANLPEESSGVISIKKETESHFLIKYIDERMPIRIREKKSTLEQVLKYQLSLLYQTKFVLK